MRLRCLVLLTATVWTSAQARDGEHHIYKTGLSSAACSAESFHPSYWTEAVEGSCLVGTAFAQSLIWKHQHPTDCTHKKFLVWLPTHHGIGSNIHCLGQTLAVAMTLNRVLIIAEDTSHPYYDAAFCGATKSFHDCYFEPVSSCTLADVAKVLSAEVMNLVNVPELSGVEHDRPDELVLKLSGAPRDRLLRPPILQMLLDTSPIDPTKHYYWWRAQSAAFLVRPNNRTLEYMNVQRMKVFPKDVIDKGTISCHIRRGDKWTETTVTEDAAYMKVIEDLLAVADVKNLGLKREIFLSTEDPEAVNYFQTLEGWSVHFTNVPRKPDQQKTTMQYAREIGPAREMIFSLINLDLALKCDAWVGTLSSNWCRLIDELRSTVRCKAGGLYQDAQQELATASFDWKWALSDLLHIQI